MMSVYDYVYVCGVYVKRRYSRIHSDVQRG